MPADSLCTLFSVLQGALTHELVGACYSCYSKWARHIMVLLLLLVLLLLQGTDLRQEGEGH
jgi:hypothetical protein